VTQVVEQFTPGAEISAPVVHALRAVGKTYGRNQTTALEGIDLSLGKGLVGLAMFGPVSRLEKHIVFRQRANHHQT
jgi:hypothetical protein